METHRSRKRSPERSKKQPLPKPGRARLVNTQPQPGTVEQSLAELLVRCRAEKGLSLEDVGEAIGVSAKSVSNIERAIHALRRTTRLRLEEFLRQRGYAQAGLPDRDDRSAAAKAASAE